MSLKDANVVRANARKRVADEFRAIGANFVQSGLWRSFAVRDGNLVTVQQNFSGAETARLVIEALGR